MEFPKQIKCYCPKCDAHTDHKLKEFKKGKRKFKARKQRRFEERKKKGYGAKVPKPIGSKKQGKQFVALAECAKCKTKVYFVSRTNMKKAAIGQKEKEEK